MGKVEFQTYKCNRDSRLNLAEDSLRNYTQSISENKIYDFGLSVFNQFVSNFETDPNIIFTKHIFRPFYTKSEISKPEECGFLKFFSGVIRNKIREHFKRLFLTDDVISTLLDDINYIRQNIPILTNIPKIKWLSVPIIAEEQVYRHDYTKGIAELSFVEREYFSFCIQDKKCRLASLLEVGAEPKVPIITFKHRKLILNLPFEVSRTDVSKPLNVESKYIEMGVDLGLTDFAVVSVKNKTDPEHPYEIDRYFIGSKQLFDMRFNSRIGKFVFRQGYTHRKSSNIKLKLINLRENIATIQRKLIEFENRCIDRGLNPKKKLKFNKLSNTFSILWDRIHNINLEIVRLLNHHIIAIANYHGASKIKMENLRFSKHVKKRERGKYLSFWQMHWLFSQIQEAIAFQAYLHNIDFERVNTSYSSQRCSKCGRVTYLDFNGNKQRTIRDGKRFVCQNVLEHTNGRIFRLDADLNAARII